MYIEFGPTGSISAPSQSDVESTSDHLSYYTNLSGADILRVDVAPYSRIEDSGHYNRTSPLAYEDNKITFTGFTSDGGASGIVNGSAIHGDVVYGAAIVVQNVDEPSINPSTLNNDIVIARGYFDPADYITVATARGASIQMGLNLIDGSACTDFAEGAASFTALPTDGNTVTLIDNAPTPATLVFEFDNSTTTADGSQNASGHVIVGIQNLTASADVAIQFTSAVNGSSSALGISASTIGIVSVLAQDHCGPGGNTTVSNDHSDTAITPSDFSGGA